VDGERTRTPFPLVRHHALLGLAGDVTAADGELAPRLDRDTLAAVVATLPDELLRDERIASDFPSAAAARDRYLDYLAGRLTPPRAFVAAAEAARQELRAAPPVRLPARR
jgi:hypothetical protein